MREIPKSGWLLASLITLRITALAVAIGCAARAVDQRALNAAFWWALALFVLATMAMLAEQATPALLRAKQERRWRRQLAQANLSLDENHRPDDAATVQAATQSAEKASTYTVSYLGPIVAAVAAPVGVLAVIGAMLSWPVAGLLALTTLGVPILVRWAVRSLRGAGAGYGRASGKLAASFLTGVRTLRSALVLGATRQRRDQIAGLAQDMRTSVMKLLYRNQAMILVTDGAFGLATMTVAAGCGLYQVAHGGFSPVEAIALVLLARLIIEPVNDMGRTFYTGASGKAALNGIRRILRDARVGSPIGDTASARTEPAGAASIGTAQLAARRGKDTPVNDVSFTLPAGGHLAIVGPSGSGKSSLLLALAGLVPLAGGSVTIDAAATTPAERRRASCYVPQNPTVLSGTVAANVDLAERGATEDQIRAALDKAALDLEPDQVVGEHRGLSGGEAARLALARGFLTGTPIILLDEPTANLDRATAATVREAAKATGATIIEVTHRLDEARDADDVIALEAGRQTDPSRFFATAEKQEGPDA